MNGIPKIDHPTISNKDITVMINLIVYLLSMPFVAFLRQNLQKKSP